MGSIKNGVLNVAATGTSARNGMSMGNSIASPYNQGFRNSANQFSNYINTNAGEGGYTAGYNRAKKDAADLSSFQSAGAGAQALGASRSTGMTKGRAANDASNTAAQQYSNTYGQNFANQQNAYNQQLANQLNAQGTLMGANLTNDQAEYQQLWGNVTNGTKMNLGFGGLTNASDKRLKDYVKVGIDANNDERMGSYQNACKKLRYMNPNKVEELKWRKA